MKLAIIYDNNSLRNDLQADWGFSCLVNSAGTNLVFDTGAKAEIFASNLVPLGLSRSDITSLFISHNHYDHAGGLAAILNDTPLQCILPASSKNRLGSKIRSLGGIPTYVRERTQIAPHVWSTGEMKGIIHEQSLVIEEGKELILITGCAHPGIVNIAEKVRLDFGKTPTVIIGGLHFFKTPQKTILQHIQRLKQLGVQRIAPCHCTGNDAINLIKEFWGEGFLKAGAGWTFAV